MHGGLHLKWTAPPPPVPLLNVRSPAPSTTCNHGDSAESEASRLSVRHSPAQIPAVPLQ